MRSNWLVMAAVALCLILGGVVSAAAPVAEPKPGEAKQDEHPSGAHPKGAADHAAKEPKNPFAFALDLTLWTIVVFALLLIVLRLFAWKPMLEALQGREKAIADALAQAKNDRDEAARMHAQFQQELSQASEKVREMLDEARRDAQHTKDEMVAAARAEVQSEKERGRREIALARDQALQDIWNKTIELASAMSSTTIRRRLSPDDHRGLVDEALAGLGDAAADWRKRGGSQSA